MKIPRATYRVQLHRGFTFENARAIVPYLARLGISHLYASPFFKARPGSEHGYDIVDHAAVNPEIGTRAELDALVAALEAHEMGLMVDVVPNHMGVLGSDNRWWLDVLEHGRASRYASYFDIDWEPAAEDLRDKVLLPILGDTYGAELERGRLELRFDATAGELSLWYHEHRLPIRPAEYRRVLASGHADGTGTVPDGLHEAAAAFASVPVAASTDVATRGPTEPTLSAKRALAAACRDPSARQHVERNVRTLNGAAGEPSSFDALDALIARQAYRLAYWRVAADDINYRRFFDINDLAALRAECADVFEATHRLVLELIGERKVECLRIDHPDGLRDPEAYFRRLQSACASALGETKDEEGHALYVAIEKILATDEALPGSWPVAGTTGYRFMNIVNGLFVDREQRERLDRIHRGFTGESLGFADVLRRSKTHVVVHLLSSELNRLTDLLARIARADRHTRDFTRTALRRALVEIVACFPIYRTYVTASGATDEDRRHIARAVDAAKHASAGDTTALLDFIGAVLAGDAALADAARPLAHELVARFQQFSAPAMAKGMEDTAFYVYNRLVSLNEVGGDPGAFGCPVEAFHRECARSALSHPNAMLATATHDSKRGEDLRARIDVLSELPAVWRFALSRWRRLNHRYKTSVEGEAAPSRNDEYLLYQTLIGAWPLQPLTQPALDPFRARIDAYMRKAVREAKTRTSWIDPRPAYEDALARFIDALLGIAEPNPFIADMTAMTQRLDAAGCLNSLSQLVLKHLAPGVPDTYQGTELWDLSLVDPDNRRPVDYALRERMLDEIAACRERLSPAALLDEWKNGRVKLWLLWRLLQIRRQRPRWFERADYLAVEADGAHARSVCAFRRKVGGPFGRTGDDMTLLCVVPRLSLRLLRAGERWPIGALWDDTAVVLPAPESRWRNLLTGEHASAELQDGSCALRLAEALRSFPMGVFEAID